MLCIDLHLMHQTLCSFVDRNPLLCGWAVIGLQSGLMSGRVALCWPCHDGINCEWTSDDELFREVVSRWLIKRPHSAPLSRWVSALRAPLQPGPKRNRYSCLLPGHVDLFRPCLQGLGGGPLTYYLVLASLSLEQRDLHQRTLSAGLFYIHSGCTGLLLCRAFSTMQGVLLLWPKVNWDLWKANNRLCLRRSLE